MTNEHNQQHINTQNVLLNKQPFLMASTAMVINNIKKRWWLILLLCILGGILGYYFAAKTRQMFQSNLTFVVDEGGSSNAMGGALSLAAQFGLNIGGANDIFSGDNIIEIIKSRRLIEKVLLSIDTFENKPFVLAEYYQQINEYNNKKNAQNKEVHFTINKLYDVRTYQEDSTLFNMYNDIATEYLLVERPDNKLNIFAIKFKSINEKFTKVFTDKLIKEADKFYIEICSKKAKETLDVLESRVMLMKGNLNTSISNKAASQDENLNPAFAQTQVPILKQQTNIQVYGAAYGEMFKNLELARFQYLKKIPLVQIIDAADYPMKKIKMGKLKTAIIGAIAAAFIYMFFIWLIGIYKLKV
jgi:Chain length determinant protein